MGTPVADFWTPSTAKSIRPGMVMGTAPFTPAPTVGRSSGLRKESVRPKGPGQAKNHSAKSEVGNALFLQITLGFSLSLIRV